MNDVTRWRRALEFLIEQNTLLHRRLVQAGAGDLEEACQAAAVAALLAVATAEGVGVDTLSDEGFDQLLAQIESDIDR